MTQPGTVLLVYLASSYTPGEKISDTLIQHFANKLLSFNVPVIICSQADELKTRLKNLIPNASEISAASEIAAIRHVFADKKIAHICIANGIFPLMDLALTQKIAGIHGEYRADISYGENLPAGIAPNFVSRDFLESLDIMEARDSDLAGMPVRAFVEKNINQFHAEVHYEEPDLRLMRLDFSLASKRSLVKAAAFLDKLQNKNEPYAELESLIAKSPELLVTFPSYIELEFCSVSEHKSFFSPLGFIDQQKHLLSRENFTKVKSYIATGLGDTSVSAAGLGEPLENPDAVNYLKELLDDSNIRHVFVETNGIHLDKLLPLAGHALAHKLRVIMLLNSLGKYAEYSGAPATTLEKVKANVRAFTAALQAAGKNPQETVFMQAFKVEENEAEIDTLYALAEELGASFLLQKYNRYAGLMPERRVSDMTPLERYSCWHLRRDLFIRANGDIAFCKQTIDQSKNSARGNLVNDALADIWSAQRQDFILNFQQKYPPHLPCASCDEYFTFNF